jgi:hypothetical protein
MSVKFANNAFGTLNAGISNSATSLTLSSGQGARFPTLVSGEYFYATLIDTSNNLEVVKCTARSTDVLTITRAQESTTAQAFAIGDRVELRITAQGLIDLGASSTLDADTSPSLSADLDLNGNDIVDGSTFLMDSGRLRFPNASSNPSSPSAGDAYYNTTEKAVKHYDGTSWVQMSNKFSTSGGTETSYTSGGNSYKVHTFTSSATFSVEGAAGNVDILIVAGGGGTGATQYHNGGGGAGAVLVASNYSLSIGEYAVTIGAGGAGGTTQQGSTDNGQPGGNSSFGSIATANGGGAGGTYPDTPGDNGGSGGGGAANGNAPSNPGGSTNQPNVTGFTKYGNDGGDANPLISGVSDWAAGGGGGAGGAGGNASSSGAQAGDGGVGIQNNYRTGSNVYYGGGGGGSAEQSGDAGSGGAGGGGDGSHDHTGQNGTANTGGGAGALERNGTQTNGKNGGSGIVVVRYQV